MRNMKMSFKRHPELEPTGKVTLLGTALCTAERMNAYTKRRYPNAPELAEDYLRISQRYGIRGDIAYCQMIYDTRGWTSKMSGPYWEPMTLEQWSNSDGIERLMQMLYSFASELPLPEAFNSSPDQIAFIAQRGWRGKVCCWEDLNGKWTSSGHRYGQDIVAMWRNMLEWQATDEVIQGGLVHPSLEDNDSLQRSRQGDTLKRDWSSLYSEEMLSLKQRGLLPSTAPHPQQGVTWAELALILSNWENRTANARMEEEEMG